MATTPADKKKKVTSAKAWKKSNDSEVLELPSENVCKLKRPGLPELLAQGLLPDMLSSIAQNAVEAGESGKALNVKQMNNELSASFRTPAGMLEMFDGVSRVTAYCVLEPKVRFHKQIKPSGQMDQIQQGYKPEWEIIPEDKRDEEYLYTDEVDQMDQMYIFQFVVGGQRDLERFRAEFAASVASVESESGLSLPPV